MLIDAGQSVLAVIDMQTKLLDNGGIDRSATLTDRVQALVQGANWLGVPILVSEQYPQRLGQTVSAVSEYLPSSTLIVSKLCFAASEQPRWYHYLEQTNRQQILLTGVEAHVCILQTALDLLQRDRQCFVIEDAVDSYSRDDHGVALTRMRQSGVSVVSTEMVLFEWMRTASHSRFKDISQLVKQLRSPPKTKG